MSDAQSLTDARRALAEKYLRGDVPIAPAAVDTPRQQSQPAEADSRERVVAVQTAGSERPFFFLHGQWESGGFFCYPIARALGPDRPFYALDPYRFDGLSVPPSFEAMAAAHVKSLRAVAPAGPYVLGGWCNGGLLAYEMARQLHADGQEVTDLVLLDPVYLRYPARLTFVRGAMNRLGKAFGVGEPKQLEVYLWLRQGLRFMRHLLAFARSREYRRTNRLAGFGRVDYPGIYDWTAMDYRPSSLYPGKIKFFWSVRQPFRRGWRQVEATNEVEAHVLPYEHEACLDEGLGELIEGLRKALIGAGNLRN
jgi:hypothetical protein